MVGDNKQIDLWSADPFTRIDPKCNQGVPWSLHTFPENFMRIGPAVMLLTKKQTKKQRKKEIAWKQYPAPPTGGGVNMRNKAQRNLNLRHGSYWAERATSLLFAILDHKNILPAYFWAFWSIWDHTASPLCRCFCRSLSQIIIKIVFKRQELTTLILIIHCVLLTDTLWLKEYFSTSHLLSSVNVYLNWIEILWQESRAVAGKPRDAAAVLFGLKFANNIHYKFKSIAELRKPGFRAPNIPAQTEFNAKRPFTVIQVMCFGVSGKAIRDKYIHYIPPAYLLRFRRCSVQERYAVFLRIPNNLRITSAIVLPTSPLVTCM